MRKPLWYKKLNLILFAKKYSYGYAKTIVAAVDFGVRALGKAGLAITYN